MKRIINLKQLSQKLGLSQTTVSRALNGFPEVSEKTRERVQRAAKEFNYRPSPSASSLATGKAKVIGHVVPLSEHKMINPHFSDFLAGASGAYSEAGYDLLIRAALPEDERNIYQDFAARNRVDGVIVHGPMLEDPRIELLKEIGLPFAVHGRTGDGREDYSWLDVDNRLALFEATKHLVELGHKRIGLVNGLTNMTFAQMRFLGYCEALESSGLPLEMELVVSADMTESHGYNSSKKLLSADRPPSAILFSSILSALGGLRALNEVGLKPGRDVSLMTFDDKLSFLLPDSEDDQSPFFTAMQSSIQDAGRRLGEILIEQINNPQKALTQELWHAELVEGQTTGRAP